MKVRVRTVFLRGNTYLRLDDVVEFIQECGSGEETDVRNRLKEAASNLVIASRNLSSHGPKTPT